MKRLFSLLLTCSLLSVAPAWGGEGDWDRAKSAHERGDYAAELALIRPLAEKGYPFAQFNLGVLYDQGHGVPQDYGQARQWYQKAAEQGLSQAQINLGILYEEGQGVQVDYVRAYFWYALADSQGDGQAPQAKEDIAKKMTAAQIQEAEQHVKEWQATHIFKIPSAPAPDSGTPHGGG
ncbi:MAG: tetratricopeptide repeat protein [Candidatus Competibacteraceae bacterium]